MNFKSLTQKDILFFVNLNTKFKIFNKFIKYKEIEEILNRLCSDTPAIENIFNSYKFNELYDIDEYIPEISFLLRNGQIFDSHIFHNKKTIYEYEMEIRKWLVESYFLVS